jgi:hypothetical protein
MPRALTAPFIAALAGDVLTPAIAARFEFAGDIVRAWTGPNEITWDSQTWVGLQGACGFDALQETSDTRITSVTSRLSYVPNDTLPELNDVTWKGLPAAFYVLLFDSANPTSSPVGGVELFRGTMDTMMTSVGAGGSDVSITVVNELVRMRQSWGETYSDADQKLTFPDDTAGRFMQSMQDVKIKL